MNQIPARKTRPNNMLHCSEGMATISVCLVIDISLHLYCKAHRRTLLHGLNLALKLRTHTAKRFPKHEQIHLLWHCLDLFLGRGRGRAGKKCLRNTKRCEASGTVTKYHIVYCVASRLWPYVNFIFGCHPLRRRGRRRDNVARNWSRVSGHPQ